MQSASISHRSRTVVAEHATLLKNYRIGKVVGDHYAGLWPRERYEKHGITYMPSAKSRAFEVRDFTSNTDRTSVFVIGRAYDAPSRAMHPDSR
jgi:hypothetical protein